MIIRESSKVLNKKQGSPKNLNIIYASRPLRPSRQLNPLPKP